MKVFHGLILGLMMSCVGGPSEEQLALDFAEGNRLLKSKQYRQAITTYDALLKERPEFIEALNNRGVAYMEEGYHQKALQDYDRALNMQPDYYDAAFNRTKALWNLGRWHPAVEELVAMTTKYDSAALYFRIGQIYYDQGNLTNALEAFDKVVDMDTSHVEGWINGGNIQFYLGNFEQAQADITKALEIQSDHPMALNTQALLTLQSGNSQHALLWINRALEQRNEDAYFLNNKGQIYLEMDSLKKAETYINQSLLLDPENPWAFRNKAIWYLKKNEPQKALDLLDQLPAISKGVKVQEFYFYRGVAAWALGLPQEACNAWQQGKAAQEESSAAKWREYCQI